MAIGYAGNVGGWEAGGRLYTISAVRPATKNRQSVIVSIDKFGLDGAQDISQRVTLCPFWSVLGLLA